MSKQVNLWKRISEIGTQNIPENEKRSVIFLNRINFFIINISLWSFIATIFVYNVIQGHIGKPGIGALRLLLMLVAGLISFIFTAFHRHLLAKIITIILAPFLLIVLPTLLHDISIEYYFYYPAAGIAAAMIPIMLFPNRNERVVLFILLFYCFLLTVTSDNLLSYFSETGSTPEIFKDRYIFYKLSQILLFIFIVSTVYSLKDINIKYEGILNEKNRVLSSQKDEVENYKNRLEELVETRTSALRDSESRFRSIFENANDAIFIMKDDVFIDCNLKTLEMFGSKKELIVGKAPYELSPFFQAEGVTSTDYAREKINAVLQNNPQQFEWIHQKMDGTIFNAEVSLNTIELNNQTFLLAIVRDVTQRKKSEYELRQSEHKIMEAIINTEESERSRIAQDLHDGLGPVLSTIKLYFQVYKDTNDQEKRNMLSERLSSTIQEAIKGVSEISHNISPHVLKNYGFYAALKQFIHRIALTNVVKIHLHCNEKIELNPNTGIILYRAISELINNSIKHASCSNITLRIYQEAGFMHVDYMDDGHGFDFIAISSSPDRGSGLNNIVNRVNALKGKIDIESKIDHGMKACLKIPV
jgi:PAS domain S-box-containing protein